MDNFVLKAWISRRVPYFVGILNRVVLKFFSVKPKVYGYF